MQGLKQVRPCFEAMECERFIEFAAEIEMDLEDLLLFDEVGVFDP